MEGPKILIVKAILLKISFLASSSLLAIDNAGVLAFNDGRYQDAEEFFLAKVNDQSLSDDAFFYLGKINLNNGNTGVAIKYIEKALSMPPLSVEEALLAGHIYCEHGQRSSMFAALKMAKKCISYYDAAVDMAPDNIEALVSSIRFYVEAPSFAGGSTKKGGELLARLQKLSPEDADTHRIQLFEKEEKEESALALADALSKREFKSAINQYEVAHYYKNKKLHDKARPLFESLLTWTVTPENRWYIIDSFLQIGEIYIDEGLEPGKGVELIEKYKEKNNNINDAHYFWSSWSLAKGYKMIGEKDKYEQLVNQIKSENYKKNQPFAKEFEKNI